MRYITFMLILGCAASTEGARRPTQEESELLLKSARTWELFQPTVGKACQAYAKKFRVVSYPSLFETGEACGYSPEDLPPNVGIHACYISDTHGFLGSQWHPTIVYWESSWLGLDYIFLHEYAHFASGCVWGNTDGEHARVDVWDNFVYTYSEEN